MDIIVEEDAVTLVVEFTATVLLPIPEDVVVVVF